MKLNWKLFAPLVVAIIVWLIGAPEGLSANSWIYVSIFAGLVVGLILEPIPPAFIVSLQLPYLCCLRLVLPLW